MPKIEVKDVYLENCVASLAIGRLNTKPGWKLAGERVKLKGLRAGQKVLIET